MTFSPSKTDPGTAMIIQARLGSTRLPGKVACRLAGRPLIGHQVERLRAFGLLDRFPLIIATTDNPADDAIADIADEYGVAWFRGDEHDITKRFIDAAQAFGIHQIIRLQGDDPLVDPRGILAVYRAHRTGDYDLTTGAHKYGWILGTAAMVIEANALIRAWEITRAADPDRLSAGFAPFDPKFFNIHKISPPADEIRNDLFLTVDYPEDFELVSSVFLYFLRQEAGYRFENRDIIAQCDRGAFTVNNRHLHQPFDE